MTGTEWLYRWCSLRERHTDGEEATATALRDMLADLDSLMLQATESLEDSYRRIEEPLLLAETELQSKALAKGWCWPDHDPTKAEEVLRALAYQIRAVDDLLAGLNLTLDRLPTKLHIRNRWLTSDNSAYVLPARRSRDFGRSAAERTTYRRRGVLRHRIIPADIRGLPLRFVIAGDRLAAESGMTTQTVLGAALFPSISLDAPPRGDGSFVVLGADIPGVQEVVVEQVARSHSDGAHAVVWPELTVDEDTLHAIRTAFGKRAMEPESNPPAVIVAGSWHVVRGDATYNLATLLSGKGRFIGDYSKVITYEDREHGREDIRPGGEIVIVVTERFLAAIAICKDYCDLGVQTRWRELDVDIVLVPSMGEDKTMASHLEVAAGLRRYRNQRAFVVQQAEPREPDGPVGYVLGAPREVPTAVEDTETDDKWTALKF